MRAHKETPSQTAGPYVHIGCVPAIARLGPRPLGTQLGAQMIRGPTCGELILVEMTIRDGADDPVRDALVEIWQAGPEGRFGVTENFCNWGRQAVDFATGQAGFSTLKPGPNGPFAPHILVWIVARGINVGLTTRIYFPEFDNRQDPVFALAGRRARTLVATPAAHGYAHEIRLQGERETVFFDV